MSEAEDSISRKRVAWIDSAKGIAIILVVIGHVVGGYTGRYEIPKYQAFIDYSVWLIYTFHMPLFFVLCGYVYSLTAKRTTSLSECKSLLRKKAVNLMIPYYVFSILDILIKLPLQGRISTVFSWKDIILLPVRTVAQYWFLYTLFLCFILTAFLELYCKRLTPILCAAVGMWAAAWLVNNMMSDSVLYWLQLPIHLGQSYLYFCFGVLLCRARYKFNSRWAFVNCMVFLLLQWVTYFGNIDFGMGLAPMRVCLAVTAIITVLYVADTEKIKSVRWLRYVGMNTMSIYVVHPVLCAGIRILLYKAGITNFMLHLLLGIVLSVVIPLAMQRVFLILRARLHMRFFYPERRGGKSN